MGKLHVHSVHRDPKDDDVYIANGMNACMMIELVFMLMTLALLKRPCLKIVFPRPMM